MRTRWLGLLTILLIVSGCTITGSPPDDQPDYTPVPDRDLFTAIDDLPAIASSDIRFNDTFPESGYVGRVVIEPDADGQATLDAIYAILRQGRLDATIGVSGTQGDRAVRFELLPGSSIGTPETLEKRYGPQPGDGLPPSS